MPAPLAKMAKHRGGRFFDRAAGDVDKRPVVSWGKPPRGSDFLPGRLPIDILIVIAMGFEPEEAVLANLHDPFRRGVKSDYQRTLEHFETRWQWHARHQRDVGGFHSAIGKVDRSRRLRGSRHSDQHH